MGQLPKTVEIEILKAEDARRYDAVLERLLSGSANERTVVRALLATGRIGDERAVPRVATLLVSGSPKVREMAAFALGEIESLKGADAILKTLDAKDTPDAVRARAVEAAGKIAAAKAGPANAPSKDPKIIELGDAILDTLESEDARRQLRHRDTVLLGLTAALRARPAGGDTVVALFLTNLDPRIRSDAANTLARLRAKNANLALRGMLMSDDDAIARANAARALGAAEDKESVNMLIDAATEDEDSRVRVSAIRTLATLRDPYAVERLLAHGEKLLAAAYGSARSRVRTGSGSDRISRQIKQPVANPAEKNEVLEIAATLGRLIPKTNDARTVKFLTVLGEADRYRSPETEIAFARIAPKKYSEYLIAKKSEFKHSPRAVDAALQGVREFATLGTSDEETELKRNAVEQLRRGLAEFTAGRPLPTAMSVPELLRSLAAFKPDDLAAVLRRHLKSNDVFVRAAAAELLGDTPPNKENTEALDRAFDQSLLEDKIYNDAQLAILDALSKQGPGAARGALLLALNESDYLVRSKAWQMIKENGLEKDDPAVAVQFAESKKNRGTVTPFNSFSRTKLGVLLNTDADYKRAAARKNGSVKAVLTTQKGAFTIDLLPEDAPLTVDNFIKLARSNYFNGLEVHRVVPNFVMQDGDPRGDGNGSPGWTIRCEVNMVPYDRGAVGMALSGKDTGGSQWFVTHSPQPHLDGGYTVFGKVNETDMKVVDRIVRGDKILSARIVEGISPQKTLRHGGTEARSEQTFLNPLSKR